MDSKKRRPSSLAVSGAALLAALLVFLPSALLLAAGDDAQGHHEFRWNVEGYFIINFIVMVALLVWFVRKPITRMVEARHKRMVRELEIARRVQKDAEDTARHGDRCLAELDEDVQKILAEARAEGETQRARLIAEGEATAQKLIEEAELRVDWRKQMLNAALRDTLAEQSIGDAEALLQKQDLGGRHQDRFLGEFLDRLERLTAPEVASLRRSLKNPSAERARREELLRTIVEPLRGVHTKSRDLFRVLNRDQQTDLIEAVLRELVAISDERQGQIRAKVRSAFALAPERQEALRAAVEKVIDHPVVCDFDVQPDLLGGVVVEVGHTVLDGSLRTQLDRMRAHLLTEH
jgi:ATP synthase F1 delta subunit